MDLEPCVDEGADQPSPDRSLVVREVARPQIAVGDLGRTIGEAAIAAGHGDVRIVAEKDAIAHALIPQLAPGDVVLLKASRALALETLLDDLQEAR